MNAEDIHTPSPSLVAPREASVVNGNEVTFVWEEVENADAYRLQVASTTRFETLHLDEEVGQETAVTVGNHFPTDGQTLFWRVLVETDDGWSQGTGVESFIAGEEDELAHAAEEGTGPVTELARAKRRDEVPRSVFELEDRFEREKERGVAYEGVAARQIMGISAAIIAVILVAVAIIFGWFGQVRQETQAEAALNRNYEEIRQVEVQQAEQLQQYGVGEEGYQIPIDRAMDLVVTEEYQQQQ